MFRAVHRVIAELGAHHGVLPGNIVLGGFSQGGSLALSAGLAYPASLGGIVSISGWCADRAAFADRVHPAQRQTPVLFSCGTADPVVDFELAKLSGTLLAAMLGDAVTVMHSQRKAHPPKRPEMDATVGFMQRCLATGGR